VLPAQLGIAAFYDADLETAGKDVGTALAAATKAGDAGAQIRFLTILAHGLVESKMGSEREFVETAVREGWRAAASMQWAALGPEAVPDRPERSLLLQMLARGVNAPWTTSVGRLFDAVASMAGVAEESCFEGQAAMMLERQIGNLASEESYLVADREGEGDWRPLIEAVHRDVTRGVTATLIAARFHNALANWIVSVAGRVGVRQV
jgi:hydrogenase maturation factor HypF (carbamoyltransferase family)